MALVVGTQAAVSYFVTIVIIMFASMVADTLDLQELETGNRQEGLFNSVITFSSKATSGAGRGRGRRGLGARGGGRRAGATGAGSELFVEVFRGNRQPGLAPYGRGRLGHIVGVDQPED